MALRNRLLKMFLALSMPLLISSCGPDLGVFEDGASGRKDYYASFGDVKGLYDGGNHSYNVKNSLYNETTVNELSWEDDDYEVKQEEYVYLIVPFKEELKIEAVVLMINPKENINIEINCFYFINETYAPQNIKYLSSPDTEIIHNEETGEDEEVEIEYDDPPKDMSMTTIKTVFNKEEWYSFVLGDFKQEGYSDKYLHTGQNGLLYIRFENNSGFNRDTMTSISFNFINLMVRAV